MSESLQQVLTALDQQSQANVEDLKALLRIPSISADSKYKADVVRAAEFVRDQLLAGGCEAELVATPGHPIVFGGWTKKAGAPTVLVYGHYDVQPPDPLDEWETPPFEPDVREGHIYARGATDDKGQMLTHIKSVQGWLQTVGDLPVNVKFVIEGEEEVGSRNLEDFLASHQDECRADVAVVSDTAQYGPNMPAITYGLRGMMACEICVQGPHQDLHSGVFGGSIANPVNTLCQLIAQLQDDRGRIQVPGFYDDVVPLTKEERAAFAELPFDEEAYLKSLGVAATQGEEGFSTLERRWARPTCDVNGIVGGYTGEGPKTIIPAKATAKLSFRLVPRQDAEQLMKNLEQFLRERCPAGVKLTFKVWHGCPASLCDTHSPYMAAARTAIEQGFGVAPVMIREGGSIPVVGTFQEQLGVDTLLLGWGQNTDNLHGPNEKFDLNAFQSGIRSSAVLWLEIANQQG